MPITQLERELIDAAWEASCNAYAPYSGFAVGAAVRTQSGELYRGSNMENASYGLAVCAEVAALAAANTDGKLQPIAIAITGWKFEDPVDRSMIVTPCGRCRQLIMEAAQISGNDVRVLACSGDLLKVEEYQISDLLKDAFSPKTIGLGKVWPEMKRKLYVGGPIKVGSAVIKDSPKVAVSFEAGPVGLILPRSPISPSFQEPDD